MSPPDERVRRATADAEAEEEELPTLDELARAGDTAALLEHAKRYRAAKDLTSCLRAYEAAASAGSAEAEHAVGLFYLAGGVVPKDEKRAAALFRSAAEKGHLPARVYVANLYELGIQYKKDGDKADVWYRSVARAAKIEHAPASFEYALEMAELGCVRYCLVVLENAETTDEERMYFTRKAKAYGWREKGREPTPPPPEAAPEEPATLGDAIAGPQARAKRENGPTPGAAKAEAAPAAAQEKKEKPEKNDERKAKTARAKESALTVNAGLVAFMWGSLLVGAAVAAGYLGLEGVRALVAHYGPVLGAHEERIVLGVAAGLAVLGTLMVYTFKSVAQAILVAGLFAGVGWVAWRAPHTHLFHMQVAQAIAFGIAGFLAALFVRGIFGGAKKRK